MVSSFKQNFHKTVAVFHLVAQLGDFASYSVFRTLQFVAELATAIIRVSFERFN